MGSMISSHETVSIAVGIDLGTTSSAVAVVNPTDTDFISRRHPKAKQKTPSCVWKDPKTGEIVVGQKAFRRIGTGPSPVRFINRLMGQQTKVLLTDEEVTPEQVSAHILGEMKRQIEEHVARLSTDSTQWIVDRAIVAVPAHFDQRQIAAVRTSANLAGIEMLELLHEPTAVGFYHCWRTGIRNGVFLTYSFSGASFGASVLRCTEGEFEVLGISGNRRLGGDDLDDVLAEALRERLVREDYALELNVKDDPEDRLRFDQLRLLAEGVKKGLSNSSEFVLHDSGTLKDKEGNPVIIDTMFERPEIEALMRPLVERTIPYCFDALEQAEGKGGVSLSDADAIILAGGSTHIPMVREMVRYHLCDVGADPNSLGPYVDERARQSRSKSAEPVYEKVDTLVALGAAIRAAAVRGVPVSAVKAAPSIVAENGQEGLT